jgi:hypothetical protein
MLRVPRVSGQPGAYRRRHPSLAASASRDGALTVLLHQVIRTGVAPKRLEKILADIIYGVGDVPELVELLLKHGATPTSSSFSAVTTYGHANVHHDHTDTDADTDAWPHCSPSSCAVLPRHAQQALTGRDKTTATACIQYASSLLTVIRSRMPRF